MSSTAAAPPATDQYVNAAEAMRLFPGLHRAKLYHAALTQRIRSRVLPGTYPLYHRGDIKKLMSEAARPEGVAG
jgi:hypothetical protein